MRSALAPDRSTGWGLLLNLFFAVIEFSGETEAFGRTTSTAGAEPWMLRGSFADRRKPMSAAAVVLPFVWATEILQATPRPRSGVPQQPLPPDMAFYRKYTEGMLRRYVRLSMEAGKVPSLLGQEMFRGNVTSCRVDGFDDVVIFVHDIEKCLEKLEEEQQRLISRIALQQYTVGETAKLMGLKPRTVVRRYGQAVDSLTRILLSVKMLEPQKCCQGGKTSNY
jgi:hypothetical protein